MPIAEGKEEAVKNKKTMSKFNDSTPLAMLTLGDLREVLMFFQGGRQTDEKAFPAKRYVYGLKGIADLFHVSTKTAMAYKNGIIADACFQSGRTIVVDADRAMELFKSSREVR